MTDAIRNIDLIISNMSDRCRVIYLKSERREIAEIVINESAALLGKLEKRMGTMEKKSDVDWFRALSSAKRIMPLADVYKADQIQGRIVLPQEPTNDGKKRIILPALLYITDFQVYDEKTRAFMLKAFLDCKLLEKAYLLIVCPMLHIPDGFADYVTLVNDAYISKGDIKRLLAAGIEKENQKRTKPIAFTEDKLDVIAQAFVGLSERQVRNVLEQMTSRLCTGLRDDKHLALIQKEKKDEINKDPTISFKDVPEKETVCGLENYTKWLDERVADFLDPIHAMEMGTPAPKGVLLCGVPGTGKTATARETARRLHVPLIQFDISRLQTKSYGGSEEKLRRYLERISAFGSCVMLMDEIEKVFAVDDHTHEVKRTMLSLLLDWMQNRKANVLTFITANDISKLPPELLRDGRISGRFFAFMPSRDDLCEILQLKLKDLISGGLFNYQFRQLLEKPLDKDDNPFAKMFDDIAREAEEKQNKRNLFMTGANLEVLVEMTNREMRSQSAGGYAIEPYVKTMKECALSKAFVPQGQSNMTEIVNMWLSAQERQYQDVSSNSILPFVDYNQQDGTFVEMKKGNAYDDYMRRVIKERIHNIVEERQVHKNFLQKYV